MDELHWQVEIQQTRQRFTGHRARDYVTPNHHLIHTGLTNILKDGFQGREIRVNIIQGSDSHKGLSRQRAKSCLAEWYA
jgi:hypothetical protein